jgi:hypothetical protein
MFTALKCLIGASVLAVLRLAPAPAMSHLMFLLRSRPEVTDRWGYHIRAIHYYEPLPNFRQIAPQQLQRRRVSSAVDFRVPEQLALLCRLADSFRDRPALGRAVTGWVRFLQPLLLGP